jgi:hypothetical protein
MSPQTRQYDEGKGDGFLQKNERGGKIMTIDDLRALAE